MVQSCVRRPDSTKVVSIKEIATVAHLGGCRFFRSGDTFGDTFLATIGTKSAHLDGCFFVDLEPSRVFHKQSFLCNQILRSLIKGRWTSDNMGAR